MPRVLVHVTLKPSLLDAQGRVVRNALDSLGYNEVTDVRMGKLVELSFADESEVDEERIRAMCDRLLANPVIENYRFEVIP